MEVRQNKTGNSLTTIACILRITINSIFVWAWLKVSASRRQPTILHQIVTWKLKPIFNLKTNNLWT